MAGIELNATADQTAVEIRTLLATVDGAGSGIDADTVDGVQIAQIVQKDSATGPALLPAGATAQRGTAVQGKFWYNSTLGSWEGYDGTAWGSIGGGSTGGSSSGGRSPGGRSYGGGPSGSATPVRRSRHRAQSARC